MLYRVIITDTYEVEASDVAEALSEIGFTKCHVDRKVRAEPITVIDAKGAKAAEPQGH